MKLNADDLRQVIELLAIAITADMPVTMRNRIADRLEELGGLHKDQSPTAGTHCINLGNLLRSLPPTH
ncbi:MAG: hypothetical protein KJ787_14030 [Gammaproteobacteria bacterium]|nr:hypothetical protein [Gammaproteobacteria bacterium]MBU1647446.1 hypothetical protein [Gammaproteobacteria bacterium]MBU1973238.1 hypothetical protein [Gammaproteobacteria bacterium]